MAEAWPRPGAARLRAPGFWQRPPGALAAGLAPLGALYAAATARRVARPGERLPIPVICVGNAVAGGAGKTPAALAICDRLAARGRAAHVVSRGHGGRLRGPVTVGAHTAEEVGDEPLMLARHHPVHVSRDRAAGARLAATSGAEVVVLDDGLQNPQPAKDLTILVVDAEAGFGNGRVIPAGPLREPVGAALARTDLVLAMGPAEARRALEAQRRWPVPVLGGRLEPVDGAAWRGRRVVAFAGIARPQRFFATLRGLGAELVEAVPLGDHAAVPPRLLGRLEARARREGATLACTEKDAMRLAPPDRGRVAPLAVRMVLDWEAIDAAFERLGL